MSDTIDLLNAIGQDASLRHMPADELARVLEAAGASDALVAAVAAGGSSPPLLAALGGRDQTEPQVTHSAGIEEEEIAPLEEEPPMAPEPDADNPLSNG